MERVGEGGLRSVSFAYTRFKRLPAVTTPASWAPTLPGRASQIHTVAASFCRSAPGVGRICLPAVAGRGDKTVAATAQVIDRVGGSRACGPEIEGY
jgi:hypothetical protein